MGMDISQEISAIQEAARGSEIRQPIVNALNTLNSGTLPQVSAQDAKKILCVNSQGQWVASSEQYVPTPTGTLSIDANGTYNVTDKAQAIVNVPTGSSAVLVSKTISQNGYYNPSADNADGYSGVTVNVQGGIVPSGSIQISQNGVYDVTDKASAIVNVPASGVYGEKTISENGEYNPSDDGYDAYSRVTVNVSGGSDDTAKKIVEGTLSALIDSSITFVRSSCFASYRSMKTISLPACETVYASAFYYCSALSNVSLPICKTVQSQAFYCAGLKSIFLPECLLVGINCFANCNSLNTISLPKCMSLQSSAFYYCTKLYSAYFLGSSVPKMHSTDVFRYTLISGTGSGKIYVPESLYSDYIVASNWSSYASHIVSVSE